MTLIGPISIGIFILYAIFMLYFLTGLVRLRSRPRVKNLENPTVSVIVAVRNEEENIRDLLKDLSNQSYPKNKLQFIISDDRSTDKTWPIINDYVKKYNNFIGIKIAKLSKSMTPKKYALKQSKNQLVQLLYQPMPIVAFRILG